MGLSVILEAGLDDYYCSSGNSAGFKVSVILGSKYIVKGS